MATRKKNTSADPTTGLPDAALDPAAAADVTPADGFPPDDADADRIVAAVRTAIEGRIDPDTDPAAAEAFADSLALSVARHFDTTLRAMLDGTAPGPAYDPASPCAAVRGETVRHFQPGGFGHVTADSVANVAATRDALNRPLPAFLAELHAHDEKTHGGRREDDGPYPAKVEVPGHSYGGFIPDPAAVSALGALRALYDSADGFRFLDVATWPVGTESGARVVFVPSTSRLQARWDDVPLGVYNRVKGTGRLVFRCCLTGEYFALAPTAPVPCLEWDWRCEPGTDPDDVSVSSRPIFPGLVAAGPEAVRAALWQSAWDEVHEAAERAGFAVDRYLRALALGDDLPALPWPSAAYVAGDTFTAFPPKK